MNMSFEEIATTLSALVAADSLFDVLPGFRPHPLGAEYKGHFAVNVTNTHRILFRPNHQGDPNYRIDNPKSITAITIIELYINYH